MTTSEFITECLIAAENMSLKNGFFPRMETILYQWYLKAPESRNVHLIETAKCIVAMKKEQSRNGSRTFKGTMSWLNGFKKRYDIISMGRSTRTAKDPFSVDSPNQISNEEQLTIKRETFLESTNIVANLVEDYIDEDVAVLHPRPILIEVDNGAVVAMSPEPILLSVNEKSNIEMGQRKSNRSGRQTRSSKAVQSISGVLE